MLKQTLPPNGWRYRNIDQPRLALLMSQASLQELLAELLAGTVIDRIVLKESCDEAKRERLIAHRITFRLQPVNEIASGATDRLLNGAYGLRASYCRSPEAGSIANGVVCRGLADAIQARTIRTKDNIAEQQLVVLSAVLGESLTKASAKVWFDDTTDKRAARFEDGEVFSDAWSQNRDNPRSVESALPALSTHQIEASLSKGRSLPRPLALDVKAAFAMPNGVEYVPASKRTRHVQIHLMGWT